jgi:hypothetical protein
MPRAAIGFDVDGRAVGMMNVDSSVGMAHGEPAIFGGSGHVMV